MATETRDFYSISEETLRTIAWILGIVLLSVLGFLIYVFWEGFAAETRASRTIDSAQALLGELEGSEELESHRTAYEEGRALLREARDKFSNASYDDAYEKADEARIVLRAAVLAIRDRGYAEFSLVEGNVQYQRASGGEFRRAKVREVLYPGDYIRTADGSAEVIFRDGHTPIVLGPRAMLQLPRTRGASGGTTSVGLLEYGWVRLNSQKVPTGVATRDSEVTLETDTEAMVSWDQGAERGEIRVRSGRARVLEKATGKVVEVESRERVEQVGGELGAPIQLGVEPDLDSPPDRYRVNLDEEQQIILAWSSVPAATHYALEVADNPLFNAPIVSDQDRSTTRATLALQVERIFYWRVAAVDQAGESSPWSETRSFRVTSYGQLEEPDDDIPPVLEVSRPTFQAGVVILEGRTEPGVKLEVNGVPIAVNADGSFRRVVDITDLGRNGASRRAGRLRLAITATDFAGNATTVDRYSVPVPEE